MIDMEARAAVAERSPLESLLKRWPVVCHVDGERAVSGLPELPSHPSLSLVTDGPALVRLPGGATELLETGDLVVVHDPEGVSLLESPRDLSTGRMTWRFDGSLGGVTVLVVSLGAVGTGFCPGLMPNPFVVRARRPIDRAVRTALVEAVRSKAPEAVANAAAAATYLQCIHDYLASRPREVQMLGGLIDPEIGPVVAALMESPARDWTVETLAEVGGMSRSAFARKFRELMGVAPIDFLVEIRMWQAARRLKQQTLDMRSIALEAGYQSPAAFSVAFKRWSGETPSDFRRGT